MGDISILHKQLATMRDSFFEKEMLDGQFVQLEELEEDGNPHFVEEVLTIFFRDSVNLISGLVLALERSPLDVQTLDGHLHQLKGSSSSVGASKVFATVNQLRKLLQEGDTQRFRATFHFLKDELEKLKSNLEPYFQLRRQASLPCDFSAPQVKHSDAMTAVER